MDNRAALGSSIEDSVREIYTQLRTWVASTHPGYRQLSYLQRSAESDNPPAPERSD